MKIYPKIFFRISLIIVSALFFALTFISFSVFKNFAHADNVSYERFLPNTPLENVGLSSPTHAYADNEITAVTTAITTTDNKLLISIFGNTPTEINFANQLGQIYRFNNYLLYRENLTIHAINVYDTSENLSLTYIDSENHSQSFNCNYCGFWHHEDTLSVVVCLENAIQIFDITEDINGRPAVNISPIFVTYPQTIQKAPVAINSASVFFISPSNVLYRTDINTMQSVPYSVINPTAMIANDEYVYCIADNKIYRFSAQNNQESPTILNAQSEYDLGTISTPVDIAFKNDDLLITDGATNGSVQEFKINGDTLEFTGYAIASGLTAYNRVATGATDVEIYGNFVAVLDDYKLTVIDTENCDDYDKNGFINKFIVDGTTRFALGNGTILYSFDAGVKLADVKRDAEDNNKQITGIPAAIPNDISYQSGIYYLVYFGTDTAVVKIDEKTGEKTGEIIFSDVNAKIVAADVFGNIYVASDAYIYKNSAANKAAFQDAKKIATDLAGNIFVLKDDGKIYMCCDFDGDAPTFDIATDVSATFGDGAIKTFGLNFDRDEVFFLIKGREEIYYTTDAGNVSVKDVKPNADFNAATLSKKALTVYTANKNANVYSVTKDGESFIFNGLIEKAEEYPLIAIINVTDNLTVYALASVNGVVLVNENDLTDKAVTFTDAPAKAYVTTAVCAYAIPVIEKNGTFAMDKGDGKILLSKGDEITITNAFTLLGKTFYQAAVKVNGEDTECYIPADFTAETLAEKTEYVNYTIEKVKKTALYKNADLTDEILQLNGGEQVKLLSRENGALKIAVYDGNGTEITGYIPENALAENPNVLVRNVLIILAVFGSLAGTVSFFLLRKKR